MKKSIVRAFAVAVALFATATAAEAHTRLVTSAPTENARVASLREVRLSFNTPVVERVSTITVTAASGRAIAVGRPTFSRDRKQMAVTLPRQMAAGVYQIRWRAVSRDAHPASGRYTFRVAR